jgi:hypothetical protein
MNKKIISIVGAVVVLIVIVVAYVFLTTVDITVRLVNISSATVRYNGFTLASSETGEDLHFRAPKSSSFEIDFVGKETYESAKRSVSIKDKPETKTISAYYSKRELQKRASAETSAIKEAINKYNPAIQSHYAINAITLYRYGEWGSATLTWSGDDDNENGDNLRIVLGKTNQGWSVVNKPDILLFKDYYPTVPLDILREVNK